MLPAVLQTSACLGVSQSVNLTQQHGQKISYLAQCFQPPGKKNKQEKSQIAEQFSLPKYLFPPPNLLNLLSGKYLLSSLSSGFKGPSVFF